MRNRWASEWVGRCRRVSMWVNEWGRDEKVGGWTDRWKIGWMTGWVGIGNRGWGIEGSHWAP